MATISEVEEAIRARLEAKVAGVRVKPYPDDPKNYKMLDPKAELLVVYRGGDFDPPTGTDLVVQDHLMPFEIAVLVRNLAGHQGGYTLLETVRQALQGWKPLPGCRPMWIQKDHFLGVESGQWYWAVFAATKALALPQLDPDPSAPLSQLTFQTSGESLEIP